MKPSRTNQNRLKTRSLRVEQLESREYLSATPFDPSPIEMELLERINQMRIAPQNELARIFETITRDEMVAWDSRINDLLTSLGGRIYPYNGGVLQEEWKSLTPAPPLAWNSVISELAIRHSEDMISRKKEGHTDQGVFASWLEEKNYRPLYDYDGFYMTENIFVSGLDAPDSGYGTIASYIHECLVIDFNNPNHGHRNNILDPNVTELGMGVVDSQNPGFGPYVSTFYFIGYADFENQFPEGGYLMGLVYDDANTSRIYEAGEGLSGMVVTIEKDGELIDTIETLTAGAYQTYLPNGNYTVTVSGEGFSKPITKSVTINGTNAKLDFLLQDTENQKPILDLNGPEEGIDYYCEYTEHSDPAVLVSELMTLMDSDHELLNGAVIKITNLLDGHYERLTISTAGTALSMDYVSETGTLTISGLAPINDYIKVLKTLTYQNLSDFCSLDDRIVEVQVYDGTDWSDVAKTTVRINPVSLPVATVEDVRVIEGDDDTTELVFVINLDQPARREVVIDFAITPGTAVDGMDYEFASNPQITIPKGESSARVVVKVKGDYDYDYVEDVAEKTLTLDILNYENVEFANDIAKGIIQEDDKIEPQGSVSGVDLNSIIFENGCRRLYSFQAKNTGRVSWDAYVDTMPENIKLTYYLVSHSGIPQASSSLYLGRQHLEFDVEEGYVYVIKVEWLGDVTEGESPILDRIVMKQVIKETDGWLEIDTESTDSRYKLDLDNDRIGIDDSWSDFSREKYPKIRFVGGPGNSVEIIGGGDEETPVRILPDGTVIDMDGTIIDVSGFELIEIHGTDGEHNAYHFEGTDGNDSFLFRDGESIFITDIGTENGKVFKTYGVNDVTVDGKGGFDTAKIYDTIENDMFLVRSALVSMTGGGYHIETQSFNDVVGISAAGGTDMNYAYGENHSMIVMDHITTSWSNVDYYYRVLYCPHVVAINNTDDNTEKLVVVNGSSGEDFATVDNGDITVTNTTGTYYHEIKGFTNTVILPVKQTMAVSLPDTWSVNEEQSTSSDGTWKIVCAGPVILNSRPASQTEPPETDPEPVPAVLPAAISEDFSMTSLVMDHYQVWKGRQQQDQQSEDWLEKFRKQALMELMMT